MKPLIPENQRDEHDLRNVYNPNKYQNHIGNYIKKDEKKQIQLTIPISNQNGKNGTKMNIEIDKKNNKAFAQIQIDPSHPTGLEPAPKDHQYDVVLQMRKPLIVENRHDSNDINNVYNPDKYQHSLGMYVQTNDV